MSYNTPITKKDLDTYLKELAKEFRRRNGKRIPAEIILIGGASILINYGFRDTTYDMDAIIKASSSMKVNLFQHFGNTQYRRRISRCNEANGRKKIQA